MKNSAYKRAKSSWFNKALNEFTRIGEGLVTGGISGVAGIPFGDPYGYAYRGYRRGYEYERKRQKKWRRGLKGQITGSANPIYGSGPPRKGPIYGSPPRPPNNGGLPWLPPGKGGSKAPPPPGLPKIPDPVAVKMEFLTPIVSVVEKWHKGPVC